MFDLQNMIPDGERFAAANSYRGFVSRFNTVFISREFKKVFILKGGPGTGKSTILKRLAVYAKEKGLSVEVVYCSSDPSSLDGIIIGGERGKIGVLDGTAPHTADPHFPGAVEEIVNLGESFRLSSLEEQRQEIISLSEKKSAAYSTAYDMLSLAGDVYSKIRSIFKEFIDYNKAEELSSELASGEVTEYLGEKIVSSFGSAGYTFLPEPRGLDVIRISGNGYSERIVMNLIERAARERGIIKHRCPSPLLPCNTDAVVLNDKMITIGEGGINSTEILTEIPHGAEALLKMHTEALALAQHYFSLAAKHHFALEKIYTSAMDFTNNEKIFDSLCKRCMGALAL
ncbi:MAG: hypothetical protein IKA64_03960 [Clostridia bacterium]|nr:hypothetical protein [Clostridia bacterium]